MNVTETQGRSWDLSSEINLLNAILECGFENWTAVAKFVAPFTAQECEEHYMNKFILDPDIKELKPNDAFSEARRRRQLCSNGCKCFVGKDLRFKNVLSVSKVIEKENKLRELDLSKSLINPFSVNSDEDKSSVLFKKGRIFYTPFTCPGYNSERSEFEIEYDDKAELTLSLLHEAQGDVATFDNEEDNEFYKDLQLALVNSYNFRLAERERRKRIIRTHALLDRRKTYNMLQRYEMACGKQNIMVLVKFIQFMKCGPELDLFLERVRIQSELRIHMNTMLNYRRLGLKLLNSISTYEKLYAKRTKYKRELDASTVSLKVEYVGLKGTKRTSTPLTLHHLPGYSLLEDEEKDLCSLARIVPETYTSFKKLLTAECKKNGGLKLAQARHLIKIDVNKTRKMFDYLMSKGLIWPPPSS